MFEKPRFPHKSLAKSCPPSRCLATREVNVKAVKLIYWRARVNAVRCSETTAKSKKLDTNEFLLNLAKFSRIWGGGGLIFYVKTSP